MARRPRRPRRLPDFLRSWELAQLLGAPKSERDQLVIVLGAHLGLRVAEISALRVAEVDLRGGSLLVRQGKGQKDRWVPIPARSARVFEPVVQRAGRLSEWVIESERGGAKRPSQMGVRGLRMLVARLSDRAGLRHVWPHMLRHTYGTSLVEQGVDLLSIRDLMGHASLATTEIYLHCVPERLRWAADLLGRELEPQQGELWAPGRSALRVVGLGN